MATPIPAEIVQGCTLTGTVDAGDYPATAWTGAAVFYSADQRFAANVAADGADYSVSLTAAQTAQMVPGAYSWQAFASSGADRHLLASGVLRVLPDMAAEPSAAGDQRSFARRMLQSYNELFLNVSFVKTLQPDQIEQLERVRKQLEWDVKREDDAERLKAGGYPTRKIFTRFANV